MTILRKCASALVETDIDDEKVVMSLVSGEFFALKDTALAIWRSLDKCLDRGGLLADLATTYVTESEDMAADLDAFLAQLLEAGLLELGLKPVWRHRLRVAEAMLLLALARFLVARVRFSLWRATLGRMAQRGVAAEASAGELALGEACAIAVRRAAWRLQGSLCLPQTMALQWMLRRRGVASTVLLGVAGNGRRNGTLGDLHAWLELGGVALLDDGAGVHHVLLRLGTGPWYSRVDQHAKK